MVVRMGREDVDWQKAWREVRKEGGRDLVKSEEDFQKIYERFQVQPLFAAQFMLNTRRAEFQKAVEEAVFGVDPADDDQVDQLMGELGEFNKGSFGALLSLIETVAVKRKSLADSLMETARSLHPRPFKELDKRVNSDAQQSLPLEPVQPQSVPELPAKV
jgi:hypothetical protein